MIYLKLLGKKKSSVQEWHAQCYIHCAAYNTEIQEWSEMCFALLLAFRNHVESWNIWSGQQSTGDKKPYTKVVAAPNNLKVVAASREIMSRGSSHTHGACKLLVRQTWKAANAQSRTRPRIGCSRTFFLAMLLLSLTTNLPIVCQSTKVLCWGQFQRAHPNDRGVWCATIENMGQKALALMMNKM